MCGVWRPAYPALTSPGLNKPENFRFFAYPRGRVEVLSAGKTLCYRGSRRFPVLLSNCRYLAFLKAWIGVKHS